MTKVKILYKNYKGETSERNIEPIRIYFGHNDWHKEDQWVLMAKDLDKGALRDFAMKDILSWEALKE